jgi:hypothetical protein
VLGASVLLAEGASQKPQNGIRTRGSQGPDDSQGHDTDMAHQRGGFKVNSPISAGAVKCLPARKWPARGVTACSQFKRVKIHATKLAKIWSLHKK